MTTWDLPSKAVYDVGSSPLAGFASVEIYMGHVKEVSIRDSQGASQRCARSVYEVDKHH